MSNKWQGKELEVGNRNSFVSLRAMKIKNTLVMDLGTSETSDDKGKILSMDFFFRKVKMHKTTNEKEMRKWREYMGLSLLLLLVRLVGFIWYISFDDVFINWGICE